MKKITASIVAILSAFSSFALVRLPSVIASNMVLQQQTKTKLWGWSDPGEKISITASWGLVDSAKGTRDGNWVVGIPTPAAGGPYTITITGKNNIVLDNIMIGEVWICSGQSNMEMSNSPDIREQLPSCATNNIHLFRIARTTSTTPQDDCKAEWTSCDSNSLKNFSAAAYFFAKRLNAELHVPIGLIEAAWGGTPAEVWTPAGLITGDPVLQQAATQQKPYDWWPYAPGYCYNAMIAPITQFKIAGAIWYQGEGNTIAPLSYGSLFSTMIGSWRKAWNKELPFYYVQIAPFTYGTKDQGAIIREQQAKTLSLSNTGMVVVSDITGDSTDIHPKNKHDVGLRLAGWALSETYRKPGIQYKNPSYKGMQIKGDKILIEIADAPQGLDVREGTPVKGGWSFEGTNPTSSANPERSARQSSRRSSSATGVPVRALVIAGEDKVFYPAQLRIEKDRLIVWSPQVKKPVAVRYQFSNAGIGNLFSGRLPLAPFRTDDWPVWP